MSDTPITQDPRPAQLRNAESLLLVNTGDGKGKSSASFGVMLRAIARDWKVAVIQFIKSSDWNVGEEKMGRQLGVTWLALGDGFTWDSENLEADKKTALTSWETAETIINSGEYDLIILDEVTYLMSWKWVESDRIIGTLKNRPAHVNIVCTGRDASKELIEIADTVTEMKNIRHAYEKGIAAKRGIDL